MKSEATERARMPEGTAVALDNRSLEKDYSTLVTILTPGLRVLDVGCGTGAITKGIAAMVGENGYVVGIDNSAHLVANGREQVRGIGNIELVEADLFQYNPSEKFDLVVAARVLQWLSNPKEALLKCKDLLNAGGQISILDYNHNMLEWKPEPPVSMRKFYTAFLHWRSDAGMDNEIAEHLPGYFNDLHFKEIEVLNANEVYRKGEGDFMSKAGIWSVVAATRGKQMVESGYVSDEERMQAIEDYHVWLHNEGEMMIMKLKEVRARV